MGKRWIMKMTYEDAGMQEKKEDEEKAEMEETCGKEAEEAGYQREKMIDEHDEDVIQQMAIPLAECCYHPRKRLR